MGEGERGGSLAAGSPAAQGPPHKMLGVKPEREVKLHGPKPRTSRWLHKRQRGNYRKELWQPKGGRRKYGRAVKTYALLLNDQGLVAAVLQYSTVRAGKALICSVHQLCLCKMESITFSSPTRCLSHLDVSAISCPTVHLYSSYPAF